MVKNFSSADARFFIRSSPLLRLPKNSKIREISHLFSARRTQWQVRCQILHTLFALVAVVKIQQDPSEISHLFSVTKPQCALTQRCCQVRICEPGITSIKVSSKTVTQHRRNKCQAAEYLFHTVFVAEELNVLLEKCITILNRMEYLNNPPPAPIRQGWQ